MEDRELWPIIKQLTDVQEHHFGIRRFREFGAEAKARKLLKKKVFRHAEQMPLIPTVPRRKLTRDVLKNGVNATMEQLTALGQAKIAYCEHVLEICKNYKCVAFASIVPINAERPVGDFLRKDYSFLFERYFHFLSIYEHDSIGIVVFDELEKIKSHILINQMTDYFIRTRKGRIRSRLVVPEPLFVHSDLTTMIQMADIIAYVIAWGVRIPRMNAPHRSELNRLARKVIDLRYEYEAPGGTKTWGFTVIERLLPAESK